jgi:hypothetical protein
VRIKTTIGKSCPVLEVCWHGNCNSHRDAEGSPPLRLRSGQAMARRTRREEIKDSSERLKPEMVRVLSRSNRAWKKQALLPGCQDGKLPQTKADS